MRYTLYTIQYTSYHFGVLKSPAYHTSGVAFYTTSGKEVVSQDRRLVLYDKKEQRFIDDFTGYECGSLGVRQLLNIPVNVVSEVC